MPGRHGFGSTARMQARRRAGRAAAAGGPGRIHARARSALAWRQDRRTRTARRAMHRRGAAAMSDVFEIMQTTRAMRRLKPDPVPDEMIARILRAGAAAANGGNTQKWRFLVVKDPAIK